MAITNPPTKRKHLASPSTASLYIKDIDNWAVTTPKVIVYKWNPSGNAGCFLNADAADYTFDDGMVITVNASGELTAVTP